jgi:hypothetical protein
LGTKLEDDLTTEKVEEKEIEIIDNDILEMQNEVQKSRAVLASDEIKTLAFQALQKDVLSSEEIKETLPREYQAHGLRPKLLQSTQHLFQEHERMIIEVKISPDVKVGCKIIISKIAMPNNIPPSMKHSFDQSPEPLFAEYHHHVSKDAAQRASALPEGITESALLVGCFVKIPSHVKPGTCLKALDKSTGNFLIQCVPLWSTPGDIVEIMVPVAHSGADASLTQLEFSAGDGKNLMITEVDVDGMEDELTIENESRTKNLGKRCRTRRVFHDAGAEERRRVLRLSGYTFANPGERDLTTALSYLCGIVDKDFSCSLSRQQFTAILKMSGERGSRLDHIRSALGLNGKKLTLRLFDELDLGRNGVLSVSELLTAMSNELLLRRLFDKCDQCCGCTGFVEGGVLLNALLLDEFKQLRSEILVYGDPNFEEILREAANRKEKFSVSEFMKVFYRPKNISKPVILVKSPFTLKRDRKVAYLSWISGGDAAWQFEKQRLKDARDEKFWCTLFSALEMCEIDSKDGSVDLLEVAEMLKCWEHKLRKYEEWRHHLGLHLHKRFLENMVYTRPNRYPRHLLYKQFRREFRLRFRVFAKCELNVLGRAKATDLANVLLLDSELLEEIDIENPIPIGAVDKKRESLKMIRRLRTTPECDAGKTLDAITFCSIVNFSAFRKFAVDESS